MTKAKVWLLERSSYTITEREVDVYENDGETYVLVNRPGGMGAWAINQKSGPYFSTFKKAAAALKQYLKETIKLTKEEISSIESEITDLVEEAADAKNELGLLEKRLAELG